MSQDTEELGNKALDLLRAAVRETLERKRRLGQYAVVARNGKPVILSSDELSLGSSPGPISQGERT